MTRMGHHFRHRSPLTILVSSGVLLGLAWTVGHAATPPQARSNRPIDEAVNQLTQEAIEAKDRLRLDHLEPDFAERFNGAPPDQGLVRAIVNRAHRDDFVDAYIRWQLTSFDPELPEFDDREFAQLMANAPMMIENPRAALDVVSTFQRAEQTGRLRPKDAQRLRELLRQIDDREIVAEHMNVPAMGYREWMESKLGDTGPRPRQWLIEECHATITAGWSTRSVKTRISREFRDSTNDTSFTGPQRQLVADQARRLAGLKRRFVNDVVFLADGSVSVSFSNARVTESDVDNWIKRLAGLESDR